MSPGLGTLPVVEPLHRARGRPTKISAVRLHALCESLAAGNFVSTACATSGIHRSTFYEWLRLGDQTMSPKRYRDFSDAVRRAIAEGEARDLSVIDAAAQSGDWKAAVWRLERRFPGRWDRDARAWVQREITTALDRVEGVLAHDPALLERVLMAMSGSNDVPMLQNLNQIEATSANPDGSAERDTLGLRS